MPSVEDERSFGFRVLLAVAAASVAAIAVPSDVAALSGGGANAGFVLAQTQPSDSPTPTPPAPQEPAKPEPAAPKNLEPLPPTEVINILGKKVRGPNNNEDLGLVVDVIVDAEGRPRAAVVDFGGFLGVGSRKIAVDWQLFHFFPGDRDRKVSLSLGRADIQAAPEYKPDAASAAMVGPPETPASSDVGK
jgi:PRC-barrel domain